MVKKNDQWIYFDSTRIRKAKYIISQQKIVVQFTDNVMWEYYQISSTEWADFVSADSPGKYLYDILDPKPNGKSIET